MTDQNTTALATTESFGGQTTQYQTETASSAMAALATATVNAACIMAERHPREWLDVRARILKDCQRPGFARVANYSLPRKAYDQETGQYVQKNIVGPSIRFAESVARNIRNIGLTTTIIYEDDEKRIVKVAATDFEANFSTDATLTIVKRTEKKKLKKGEKPISSRPNSYGDTVFLVPATDDEIAMKQNSAVAKARRQLILQLLPGDIMEDCQSEIAKTLKAEFKADPGGAIKRVVDAFSGINIMPNQLALYFGHGLDMLSPTEVDELRGIYAAINEGSLSWAEVMEAQTGEGEIEQSEQSKKVAATIEEQRKKAAERKANKCKPAEAAKPAVPPPTETVPDAQFEEAENPSSPAKKMREPGED